jgi:hypothetical protein
MGATRVRGHTVHRDGQTYQRGPYTQRRSTQRRRPRHKLKPKRALRNARKAIKAARRNQGWAFALYASAAGSEMLAFTVMRGGGGLLSVLGVGLTGLGTAMRRRT